MDDDERKKQKGILTTTGAHIICKCFAKSAVFKVLDVNVMIGLGRDQSRVVSRVKRHSDPDPR